MSARTPNQEQRAAIEAGGHVFVSAGAGTGKTLVLVERFANAVCDEGIDVGSMLVITYTERAAGELRGRIRRELLDRGRDDLARQLDGAWISTIHGFCFRLLKAYPFAAGLDPRFRVLDDSQARVLRGEAFERALDEFCAGDDPRRLRLLATYGAGGLRRMLTGVYETLRAAGRPLELDLGEGPALAQRVDALREAAQCLVDEEGSDEQRAQAARMLEVLERDRQAEDLLDLSEFGTRGGQRERFASYEAARKAVEQSALDELATRDRDLLQELLEGFGRAYAGAKERESGVDFEDLQLAARDLLREHEEIRQREAWRFRAVMVDEFQDTNRLQCELIDLVAGDQLFYVGDEFQSIYGFRHADVNVFRARREEAGSVLPLTLNYRSRPEVLAAVNHLFGSDFGDEFQPLAASGEFPDPVFGTPVELLVTDKASYSGTGTHWRRGEARAVARRVKELVETGSAKPGEIVLLFAAGTDAEWYEQELRELGLPTYRTTGRGYFGQQQVADLLAYLRLLHNRYDDEALMTVLASPLVGVSNDALVLLRRTASKRPLFKGLERSLPEGLEPRDERLFQAFRQRYERLVAASRTLSLERLCEEIVAAHDYDLAVLAQWDGRRRYANLRKLGRLARSYEELRGADIEGFVRFVREQDEAGAKELEAVAEEEDADVIRLLTIHAAKGLEFKVVVVADAGRDRAAPGADEILALSDGRFGFRVADPATGVRKPTTAYEEVRAASREEAEAERRRLYYVAMTRAVDRLIVAGSIDPEKAADERTPIGWVLGRLEIPAFEDAAVGPIELERGGARILLRLARFAPEPAVEPVVEEGVEPGQLVLFEANGSGGSAVVGAPKLPPLVQVPEPPLHRARSLSYSALALFESCSYRYYAERVVGMREGQASGSVPGYEGLAATEIGDSVHFLLETLDLREPRPPGQEELAEAVRARYPAATDAELERIGGLVRAYCDSALAARVATLEGAAPERPFAFEHDGVLLHGRLDVLHLDGPTAMVVDYKTNLLEDASPEEVIERDYHLQRLVYAIACFGAGAEEVEVVYQFLERPDPAVSTTFVRSELSGLEAELSAAIGRIQEGVFRPTPSEFICSGCPVLDVVCAGPRLRQHPETSIPAEIAVG
jgi:ATP-dependent helicase/nuclease subunit A